MTIFITILMLVISIIIHEYGHYMMARKFGVKVYEFSIFFGPKIFSYTSKKTGILYSLRLLPLGGYCNLKNEKTNKDDTTNDDMSSKKYYQKMLILFFGPLMNLFSVMISIFFIAFIEYMDINIFFNIFLSLVAAVAGPFVLSFEIFKSIFSNGLSLNDFVGPIGAVKTFSDNINNSGIINLTYVKDMLTTFLFISYSLFFANVFFVFIPAIDGFRMIILTIEKIIKKNIPNKVQAGINIVGVLMIFAIIIFTTVKDVTSLFK